MYNCFQHTRLISFVKENLEKKIELSLKINISKKYK